MFSVFVCLPACASHASLTHAPLSSVPPALPNYRGKANCSGGHRPWPYGICSKCMPENATLNVQPYRHCDSVSFEDTDAGSRFVSAWLEDPLLQKAALLFGTVSEQCTLPAL